MQSEKLTKTEGKTEVKLNLSTPKNGATIGEIAKVDAKILIVKPDNGKNEEKKVEAKKEEAQKPQDELLKPMPVSEVKPVKTVVQIFEKAKKINSIIDSLKKLDEAHKELDSIQPLNSAKLRDTLTITDGSGAEFSTTNNFLIEHAIQFLKTQIAAKTELLETELSETEQA